jgi:hypothetical protein
MFILITQLFFVQICIVCIVNLMCHKKGRGLSLPAMLAIVAPGRKHVLVRKDYIRIEQSCQVLWDSKMVVSGKL